MHVDIDWTVFAITQRWALTKEEKKIKVKINLAQHAVPQWPHTGFAATLFHVIHQAVGT